MVLLSGSGSVSGSISLSGGSTASTQGMLEMAGAIATMTFTDSTVTDTDLSVGGTSLGAESVLDFRVGSSADRLLLESGKFVVNPGGGLIEITPEPGLATGTYDLIDFNAGQASGLNNLFLYTPTIDGYSAHLQSTATAEELVITPEPAALVLLAAGGIGLVGYGWWRRRTAKRTAKPTAFDQQADDPAILAFTSHSAHQPNMARRAA